MTHPYLGIDEKAWRPWQTYVICNPPMDEREILERDMARRAWDGHVKYGEYYATDNSNDTGPSFIAEGEKFE